MNLDRHEHPVYVRAYVRPVGAEWSLSPNLGAIPKWAQITLVMAKRLRVPRAIQEQVNRRLDNGEKGRPLVAWLNSLPEVQAVLAAEFAGQPISEQNLSRWRKYGYKQWSWHQQALAMTREMTLPLSQPLSDQMAG